MLSEWKSGFDRARWRGRAASWDSYGGGRVPRERALCVGPGGISVCRLVMPGWWVISAFSKYGA